MAVRIRNEAGEVVLSAELDLDDNGIGMVAFPPLERDLPSGTYIIELDPVAYDPSKAKIDFERAHEILRES